MKMKVQLARTSGMKRKAAIYKMFQSLNQGGSSEDSVVYLSVYENKN